MRIASGHGVCRSSSFTIWETGGWIKGSIKSRLSVRCDRMGLEGVVTKNVRASCSTIIYCFWAGTNVG